MKKSRILTLTQARRHFHLDLNDALDRAENIAKTLKTQKQKQKLSKEIRRIWARSRVHEGVGEFDKVLKRIYRLAGFCGLRLLRRRALRDVLSNPTLAERICDYVRCSGTVLEYLNWADALMHHDEQIYPDVNIAVIEGMLRLEVNNFESRRIRSLAIDLLSRKSLIAGALDCRALAPLLVLRFGDRRSLPVLKRCCDDPALSLTWPILRAAAVVFASYGTSEFATMRRSASRLMRNHLADVVRLIERIRQYTDVPVRYTARLKPKSDPVQLKLFIDMRALLTIRLLQLGKSPRVLLWVSNWKNTIMQQAISPYDRRLLARLLQ